MQFQLIIELISNFEGKPAVGLIRITSKNRDKRAGQIWWSDMKISQRLTKRGGASFSRSIMSQWDALVFRARGELFVAGRSIGQQTEYFQPSRIKEKMLRSARKVIHSRWCFQQIFSLWNFLSQTHVKSSPVGRDVWTDHRESHRGDLILVEFTFVIIFWLNLFLNNFSVQNMN